MAPPGTKGAQHRSKDISNNGRLGKAITICEETADKEVENSTKKREKV